MRWSLFLLNEHDDDDGPVFLRHHVRIAYMWVIVACVGCRQHVLLQGRRLLFVQWYEARH